MEYRWYQPVVFTTGSFFGKRLVFIISRTALKLLVTDFVCDDLQSSLRIFNPPGSGTLTIEAYCSESAQVVA
jgi:hypothetical protein